MPKELGYLADLRQTGTKGELLCATLEASVPFRMLELMQQGGPFDWEWEAARAFADVLGSEGDALLFKGFRKGDTARMMHRLIATLAVMAFVPGGITAWGLHFDAGIPDETGNGHCISPKWIKAHARPS